jgi:hypothetical protein
MQQWHGVKGTSSEEMGPRNIVDHGGYLPPPEKEWPVVQEPHGAGYMMARDTARSMWDKKSRNDERTEIDYGNVQNGTVVYGTHS